MRTPTNALILVTMSLVLTACGGGGVASIPPPQVTPPSTSPSAIIPASTTSQQFAVMGTVRGDAFPDGPTLDADSQIKVRYDGSSQSYEVLLPDDQQWQKVQYELTTPSGVSYKGVSVLMGLSNGDYQYSRLLDWNDGANSGDDAVGMATPAGGVPVTGAATYAGPILGLTSEHHAESFIFDGSIALSFDFAGGSLSGSITPNLHQGYDLGTIDFTNTVYSAGSTTFSGKFDTDAAGLNSFSGLFTGPNAEELIGNFALPYRSALDGSTYQAEGAFVGAR
jgi:hypothetical protein